MGNCPPLTKHYSLEGSPISEQGLSILYNLIQLMPKFLDVHSLKGLDEETLRKTQNSPKDEFGVTHDNIMYNKEEDKFFCLLDAPNKEAVEKHHKKHGFKCEWVTEVKTTV
jgi:Fe2+ or Zn2+ uptake regulation protein